MARFIREDRNYNRAKGLTLSEEQVDAIEFLFRKKNAIVSLQTGLGKLNPISTPIITPTGVKKMGEIKVGDEVIGEDGKPYKVSGVYPQGLKDIYKITFKDGTTSRCGLEHLWKVRTQQQKGSGKPYQVLTLKQMLEYPLRRWGSYYLRIPLCAPVEFYKQELPIHPYVLGALLGDGGFSRISLEGSQALLSFSNTEEDVIYKLNSLVEGGSFVKNTSTQCQYNFKGENKNTKYSVLLQSIRDLELVGLGGEKFIPDVYKYTSVRDRRDLLEGLFDTDGYVGDNGSFTFFTASERLCDDVVWLCRSLGYRATRRVYDRRGQKQKGGYIRKSLEYQVSIPTHDKIYSSIKHKERDEKAHATHRDFFKHNYDDLAIISIEPDGQEESQCIMVDSEDHTYLCDDFIVTHNTVVSLTAATHVIEKTEDTIFFIVCPKSANSSFIKELSHKFNIPYSVYTTNIKNLNNGSRFFLFNYSNIDDMIRYLYMMRERGLKVCLISDECHCLGSETSGLANKMRSVRHMFSLVWGLTATLLLNDLQDMYRVITYVKPGFFGTIIDFKRSYIVTEQKTIYLPGRRTRKVEEVVGYKNLDHLKTKVEEIAITRRLDYNINWFYPTCELSEEEEFYYKQAAEGNLVEREEDEDEKQFSARLHDLQRITDGVHKEVDVGHLPSKIKLMADVVQAVIARGEGVLIYTEYEDTYNYLADYLNSMKKDIGFDNLYKITGKVNEKTRLKVEQSLKANDIVILTKAGCQSINLQAVNNIIVYDISFSIGFFIQLIGRICRMDSSYDAQNLYLLEVKDTVDTYKRMLIQDHTAIINTIFGKEGNLPNIENLDKSIMQKYRSYFKKKFLWKTR